MWCTLAGGAQWVGCSCMTSAHFGHCACSGLWLLATDHDNSGSLGMTLNPVTTTSPLLTTRPFCDF